MSQESFEEDYQNKQNEIHGWPNELQAALWGASWAFDRAIEVANNFHDWSVLEGEDGQELVVRRLAQALQKEKEKLK